MEENKWRKVEVGSPENKIISMIQFRDDIYIATEDGLFCSSEKPPFQEVKFAPSVWDNTLTINIAKGKEIFGAIEIKE